jgi:dishevelled associated activator of morphogenesis
MPGAPIAPAGPKPKAVNLSSKPLKSFNWTKLPPVKVKETIWSALDDEDVHKVMKGAGYDEFEELFAAREVKVEQQSATDLSSKILVCISVN